MSIYAKIKLVIFTLLFTLIGCAFLFGYFNTADVTKDSLTKMKGHVKSLACEQTKDSREWTLQINETPTKYLISSTMDKASKGGIENIKPGDEITFEIQKSESGDSSPSIAALSANATTYFTEGDYLKECADNKLFTLMAGIFMIVIGFAFGAFGVTGFLRAGPNAAMTAQEIRSAKQRKVLEHPYRYGLFLTSISLITGKFGIYDVFMDIQAHSQNVSYSMKMIAITILCFLLGLVLLIGGRSGAMLLTGNCPPLLKWGIVILVLALTIGGTWGFMNYIHAMGYN